MRIAVTGSIATDHLMTFPGRFADQLVAEPAGQGLAVVPGRRPGASAAAGWRRTSPSAWVCSACGRSWSARSAPTSPTTAPGWSGTAWTPPRCTSRAARTPPGSSAPPTSDHNQIASFYAGAMSEARNIELAPVADRVGGLDLVVIGPNDPEAMVRHTEECRDRGYRVRRRPVPAAGPDGRRGDPSTLVDGADYLFTNEYEKPLLPSRRPAGRRPRSSSGSGSGSPRSGRTACGSTGRGEEPIQVPAARGDRKRRPDRRRATRFRAGFLAGRRRGAWAGAGGPGRLAAGHAGPRDGRHPGVRAARRSSFLERFAEAYGDDGGRRGRAAPDLPAPVSRALPTPRLAAYVDAIAAVLWCETGQAWAAGPA